MPRKIVNNLKLMHHTGKLAGILLMTATIVSLLLANLFTDYTAFWDIKINAYFINKPLILWINDGLMAVFFFLICLEIKREVIDGELSDPRKSMLSIFAAIGGVAVPALIYFFFNYGTDTTHGWAIPTATDIAFSLGILSLLGTKAPIQLKIFLTALAIIDDLIAILIIAFFYTAEIAGTYLAVGAGVFALMILLRILKVKPMSIYFLLAVLLWYCILKSGVHATIAGVLGALIIPFEKIHKFEHNLHSPVNYGILPIFALANTAIILSASSIGGLSSEMSLGIIFGLFLGKPLGIFLFTYVFIKLKLGSLPQNVNFKQILGVGFTAGVGFTMSIFISNLSFDDLFLSDVSKISIIIGSLVSAAVSIIILNFSSTKNKKA